MKRNLVYVLLVLALTAGSVFGAYLIADKASRTDLSLKTTASQAAETEKPGERVLIAEDEADLAEALTVFFEKNQFTADAVSDGFSAYEYASSGEYDAIVLDVMMPKMNGFTLLKQMRARGDMTPVLFLTARDAIEDRVCGLDLGASDYLVKPFSFDELLARIRVLTRKSAVSPSAGSIYRLADLT